MSKPKIEATAWEHLTALLFRIVGRIHYGSVELTIHDSRVVQLELRRKYRLPTSPDRPGTGASLATQDPDQQARPTGPPEAEPFNFKGA